jgi:magnesium-transporting ATPase (P-type)
MLLLGMMLMKNSRDLALLIMFAVLSFVFQALIGQVPSLIAGVPGIGYAFTIVYSIIQSVAYLMYGGRRWRIFAQTLLINSLAILPIIPNWTVPVAMASIVNSFIVDSVFNSLYGKFKRDDKLFWWILLVQVYYWATSPFWLLLFSSLFAPVEQIIAEWFVPVMSVMLPIMIVEAVAGSSLGYKIYRRVEKIT